MQEASKQKKVTPQSHIKLFKYSAEDLWLLPPYNGIWWEMNKKKALLNLSLFTTVYLPIYTQPPDKNNSETKDILHH